MVKIKFKLLNKNARLPKIMSNFAAGADLGACLHKPFVLAPGSVGLIPCGFAMAIPEGYEAQIRPRSGLAVKHCIGVLNSPGTIDADYRGEVKIILFNFGKESFTVKNGDRIAQMVFQKLPEVKFECVEMLDTTVRGEGGFGHTKL